MKPFGRKTMFATVPLVAVAVGGLLRFHALSSSRRATLLACPNEPGLALGCYEGRYRSIVVQKGVAEAFADLKAAYPGDSAAQRLCHAITHAIGRAAVAKDSDISQVFLRGDDFCGSGYYHGVLQGLALRMGRARLLSNLNSVCAGIPGKERHSLEYYNCVHGLGHGMMAVTGDDLFDALEGCGRLAGSMEENACANGVFMENLVVDGAHGGHYSRYLRPSEPLYPCTAVARKYTTACLDIQTSYALGAARGDFARVFALCAGVGLPFRVGCYRSLGRDAATVSLNKVPGTVATCHLGIDQEQRSNCIIGAVLDFVYFYHSDVQAKELCAALEPALQEVCTSTTAKLVGLF